MQSTVSVHMHVFPNNISVLFAQFVEFYECLRYENVIKNLTVAHEHMILDFISGVQRIISERGG